MKVLPYSRAGGVRLLLASILSLAGCSDAIVQPGVDQRPDPAELTRLQCVAEVLAGRVTCAPSVSRVSAAAVLGGQGTLVQIEASNASYDALSGVFSADLSVQNMTAERMGTSDGSTISGFDVFVSSGPFGSGGTVSVRSPATVGTFTNSSQPYLHYPEVLEAFGGTSTARRWEFNVPPTVTVFSFSLLVSTPMPEETGVLRWRVEHGFTPYINLLVWGTDARNVFGFGERFDADGLYTLERFNGSSWNTVERDLPIYPVSVWGSSARDIWVGGDDGDVVHFNGSVWSRYEQIGSGHIASLWGSGPNDVYAVVADDGVMHYDGNSWQEVSALSSVEIHSVFGSGANDVWAGGVGTVYNFNGAQWTAVALPSSAAGIPMIRGHAATNGAAWLLGVINQYYWNGSTWASAPAGGAHLYAVHGSSASNAWAAGTNGAIVRWNTSTLSWNAVPSGTATMQFTSIWTSGPNDAWAVGFDAEFDAKSEGVPFRWDGVSWTRIGLRSGDGFIEEVLNGVYGTSPTNVWAVGTGGSLLRNTGGDWRQVGTREPQIEWRAAWGLGPNDMWVVGSEGEIRHWNGSTLTAYRIDPAITLNAVWGTSATNVYAVGTDATIVRFDGNTWTVVHNDGGPLHGIWGSSASDIWVVGSVEFGHWDGTSWTLTSAPTASEMYAVHGTAANNIVAVGGNGTILRYDGTSWSAQSSGTTWDLYAVRGDPGTGRFVAAGATGVMVRSSGSTWSPARSGTAAYIQGLWMASPAEIFTVGYGAWINHGTR